MIVAAGGLLGCMAIGALFSLPVFLRPIARDTGWSVTGISTAMTIGFLAMALASMAWGTLSDRFGPARSCWPARFCSPPASRWPAVATSLVEFQLLFGVVVGDRERRRSSRR